MTIRHQVQIGQSALVQRAIYNRKRDQVNAVCNRINWMSADRKFCEERWAKVGNARGVYTTEQCWDGVHIVWKYGDGEGEILFDTIFESVYDALFTIKTHGLEQPPVVL